MTLGEFRELTKNYTDECEVCIATDYFSFTSSWEVKRMIIDLNSEDTKIILI